MEQLDYNLMFRGFVVLSMDAPIWDVTVFNKKRGRLLLGDIAAKFMEAVLTTLERLQGRHRIPLGADKAYDGADFIAKLHEINFTPRVAQNTANRRSAINGRTTRHCGQERVGWTFTLTAGAPLTW
jgi:hypothetical protein